MLLASLLLVLAAPRSRATDGKFWLTCSLDRIDADLVGVQAVVVKDEDTPEHGCRRSDVVDARVSYVNPKQQCGDYNLLHEGGRIRNNELFQTMRAFFSPARTTVYIKYCYYARALVVSLARARNNYFGFSQINFITIKNSSKVFVGAANGANRELTVITASENSSPRWRSAGLRSTPRALPMTQQLMLNKVPCVLGTRDTLCARARYWPAVTYSLPLPAFAKPRTSGGFETTRVCALRNILARTLCRHNVRAPLAVLVAPFSDTAQLIKVSEHRLHPNHALDPRDEHHAQHDVAVLKLACRWIFEWLIPVIAV